MRLAQVKQKTHDDHQVPQKGGQNGRADNGTKSFNVEYVDHRAQGESTRRQRHPAQHIETDPKPPGEFVTQGCANSQSTGKAQDSAVNPSQEHQQQDRPPESEDGNVSNLQLILHQLVLTTVKVLSDSSSSRRFSTVLGSRFRSLQAS